MAYALAMLNSGNSKSIYLAGLMVIKVEIKIKSSRHIWDLYNKDKKNIKIILLQILLIILIKAFT